MVIPNIVMICLIFKWICWNFCEMLDVSSATPLYSRLTHVCRIIRVKHLVVYHLYYAIRDVLGALGYTECSHFDRRCSPREWRTTFRRVLCFPAFWILINYKLRLFIHFKENLAATFGHYWSCMRISVHPCKALQKNICNFKWLWWQHSRSKVTYEVAHQCNPERQSRCSDFMWQVLFSSFTHVFKLELKHYTF